MLNTSRFSGWTVTAMIIAALVSLPLVASLWAIVDGLVAGSLWPSLKAAPTGTYVFNTTILMLIVGSLSTLIGVSTASLVSLTQFSGRRLFAGALLLPLAAPPYIIAYVYTDLLDYSGPVQSALRATLGEDFLGNGFTIRTLTGAGVLLSLVLYPYIYLLTRAALRRQAGSLFEAARSLGQSALGAYWRAILPLVRPAIAAGLALVLMETIADFGVADYFAIQTFSTGIFRSWLGLGDKTLALQLSGLALIVIIILVATERFSRQGQLARQGQTERSFAPLRLSTAHTALAWFVCATPILLGFLIPAAMLLKGSVTVGDPMWGPAFLSYCKDTAVIALLTVLVCLPIAIAMAFAQRQSQGPVTRALISFSTLGYALPGAVLAVGLLSPLSVVDRPLTRFAQDQFGHDGGLLLTSSLVALVFALTIRFLTIGFNGTSSALAQIPPRMDEAARSLGAGPSDVLRRVHLPLVAPGLVAGMLLVFVDVIRELPATLILRPFNVETLATRTYRLASDERLAEASTAALFIVVLSLIPVVILMLQSRRQRGG